MGGATTATAVRAWCTAGLSPRGRGNHRYGGPGVVYGRSIPAWAGQPAICSSARPVTRVYPRVGGATGARAGVAASLAGLSPRGRGNQPQGVNPLESFGSIPAWAGQPRMTIRALPLRRVYPRVGGATDWKTGSGRWPRGLSPRGRGNLSELWYLSVADRSIPAWAGQPSYGLTMLMVISVYPRVGGATPTKFGTPILCCGLSPRGRGNQPQGVNPLESFGSIPAWAGQPQPGSQEISRIEVYPRVGGATQSVLRVLQDHGGLSPRGRGNQNGISVPGELVGSIPAWAGQPRTAPVPNSVATVYPRVGGATSRSMPKLIPR